MENVKTDEEGKQYVEIDTLEDLKNLQNVEGIKFEQVKKDETSNLPLMYMAPFDNEVFWICDYDENKKILSMFFKHREDDRHYAFFDSEEQALEQKELLVNTGWIKCKRPEVNIFQEKSQTVKEPNRSQKRKQNKK